MKIKAYAYIHPEKLIELGEAAGLSEEAVDYLRHAEEYPLILSVDAENGAVTDVEICPDFLKTIR